MVKTSTADSSVLDSVPSVMRAAIIRAHGGPEVIAVEEVPTPSPGPDEVLLRVDATALNRLDIFARQGLKGPGVPPIRLPHVSGVDIAGNVVAYGPTLDPFPRRLAQGSRVLVFPSTGCTVCRACRKGEYSMCAHYKIIGEHTWGGLAEYVAVPAQNVVPIPDGISSIDAAALPATFTTAWRGVITVARVGLGDRVLVVGASGGVGSAQVQIAVAAGAEVLGTASSSLKREQALGLGATAMFDSTGDWESEVREWTDGEGVNAVFDSVGAPTLRHSVRSLAMGGCLVLSGATAGDSPDLSIREIYQRHRRILGAPMGSWQDFLTVTELVWRGVLRPVIHSVFPLDEIAEAERELEGRGHFGKIVIQVGNQSPAPG